ncbi:MBL fold metallo-hydrolase [Microaceticoccus formicicus]|uniref:MBL fold metallo-hydrolase n=1 Tax=Microaceticoccus formicicus TaxID=3118105 RepID=UPI003CD02794|nr:MBL fold metallo-hydrolase [Peptoniphilaceae bacterium AMB_02]
MKITLLASGSSGNAYKVNTGETTLLIECGLPYKKLQEKLKYKMTELDACLVTHEHMDHAKASQKLIENGIDLYMTNGTAEALNLNGHRLHTFSKNSIGYEPKEIKDTTVIAFKAVHDVREPVNFYIKDNTTNEKVVFITDTAYILYKIPPVDYLMIECNYVQSIIDEEVQNGKIHLDLRNRIVKNHLSLERLLDFFKNYNLSKTKAIYLLHLSSNNSDQKMIYNAVAKATGKQIYFS